MKFDWNSATLTCFWMSAAAFRPQWQSQVTVTHSIYPTKPNILWPFTENVSWPLLQRYKNGEEQDHSTNTKENLQSALGLAAEKTGGGVHRWERGAQVDVGSDSRPAFFPNSRASVVFRMQPCGIFLCVACRVRLPGLPAHKAVYPARQVRLLTAPDWLLF